MTHAGIALLDEGDGDFPERLDRLLSRDDGDFRDIDDAVARIIAHVRDRGDDAVMEYTRRFDRREVAGANDLCIESSELQRSLDALGADQRRALEHARDRVEAFHRRQVESSWSFQEPDGSRYGQLITPLERVGVYVPGGKAAYPSSVIMNVVPARVAGVAQIVMTVPTPDGVVNNAVMAAAAIAGVDRVFAIGGAQAVAALAYGTATVPAVDKIVGPGNAYVAAAKRQVFGRVGIDMIAGPSEVVVICDEGADPRWVAMDLFAQAEHDEMAQSIVICPSATVRDAVLAAVDDLLPGMERRDIIAASLAKQGAAIVVEDLDAAVRLANRIAPEHLELLVAEPGRLLPAVRHAGAVFAGYYSAESLGDYCAGPNHVLPTAGTARFSSPLGVYDFVKRTSLIQCSPDGAGRLAETASILAHAEALTAHARSAAFRGNGGK